MPLQLSNDEWQQRLTPEQFHVLREQGTERPFTGKLLYNDDVGEYTCAACGNVLFASDTKFEAHCGWPNFYDAIPGSVILREDLRYGMRRTAVDCANCGGHLGHVFDDSPEQPTGNRYCISSAALAFVPSSDAKKSDGAL